MSDLMLMAIPVEYTDAANRLAAIMDPDHGGGETFKIPASATGKAPATHHICNGWVRIEYQNLIRAKDSVIAMQELTSLASDRLRDLPLESDVINFCQHILIDDVGVVPIVSENVV